MQPGDDAPKMREIYSYLGYAMFLSQILEGGLAQAAIVLVEFPKHRDTIKAIAQEGSLKKWAAFVDSLDQKHRKKSIAELIKILTKNESISLEVKGCLDAARKDRNFVAHNFFKNYLVKLYHEEHQDEAITSLQRNCLTIQNALDQLRSLVFGQLSSYGYDEEFIYGQCMHFIAEAK